MVRRESISSAQNPKIKHLLSLQEKSRLRKEEGLFVVEGAREVARALDAGYQAATLFVCPEIFNASEGQEHAALAKLIDEASTFATGRTSCPPSATTGGLPSAAGRACELPGAATSRGCDSDASPLLVEVPAALYEKIALRGSSEGIIAEMKVRSHRLEDLSLPENALVIVLESIEKPGNLGAILRSADGAGADALIVCDPLADVYNPNVLRSSLGALFSVPTAICSSEEAIAFLQQHKVQILTAQLQDSKPYYDVDMTGSTALVIGSEADGLTDAWRIAANRHILIPMLGKMDSLNASVSAAILLYEARRQREGKRAL